MLSEANIFLPAAFLSHAGGRHTFTGITNTDGKPTNRRIDYVGLPTDWLQATTTSNVIYDFNTVATKADHFPTCVHFKFITTTQLANSPHLRLDKTWIDTREPLPLAEAVAQLCTCPVPAWDQDVHTHRHSIHTFHHEWMDPVPKQKSDAIQPYATPQILFASKRVTQIHRAIIKIYREKTKVLSRLMIHAWVASAIKPDKMFDRKRAKRAGPCPYANEHQLEGGSFAIALATAVCQRHDCDYRVALLKITLHATQEQQKVNLQQGLAQYFSHLVHNVSLSRREFWNALKLLRTGTPGRKVRAFSRTVPAVQNPQGDLYQDAEALADAWVSHFANIEGGTAVHPSLIAGLIQQERARIE